MTETHGGTPVLYKAFPTPIANIENFITEFECDRILEELLKIPTTVHGTLIDGTSSHYVDREEHMSPDPEVSAKIKHILGTDTFNDLDFYVNTFAVDYGVCHVDITDMWYNVQQKDSVLLEHSHPNSKVSGVIYLEVGDDPSPLYFRHPNPVMHFEKCNYHTEFNELFGRFNATKGDLIIFPSWLEHGSHGRKNGSKRRVALSFNTKPND